MSKAYALLFLIDRVILVHLCAFGVTIGASASDRSLGVYTSRILAELAFRC